MCRYVYVCVCEYIYVYKTRVNYEVAYNQATLQ